jgi:hypothetical protein
MKAKSIAGLIVLGLLLPHATPLADPILKPKKYHGPIPQRSFALNVGFVGGPTNEQLWDFLDRMVDQPLRRYLNTEDFGPSLAIDGMYTVKVHPQFAVRLRGGLAILNSTSTGSMVAPAEIDTSGLAPLLDFERTFDVYLLSIEGSAMYYFQDASVNEFQSYLGGGFGFYFPYAKYEGTSVDNATQEPFSSLSESKFSMEPGIHAVLGALYHFRNDYAFQLEARGQIAQSKFNVELPTNGAGIQDLNFDVDYTGFVLVAGIAKFF